MAEHYLVVPGWLLPVRLAGAPDELTDIAVRVAKGKLTPKQLEKQDMLISRMEQGVPLYKDATSFARRHHGKAGVKIPELQKIVEAGRSMKHILWFLKDVPGADTASLMASVDRARLDAQYLLEIASLPGADPAHLERKLRGSSSSYVMIQWIEKFGVSDPLNFAGIFKDSLPHYVRPEMKEALKKFVEDFGEDLNLQRVIGDVARRGGYEWLKIIDSARPGEISDQVFQIAAEREPKYIFECFRDHGFPAESLNRSLSASGLGVLSGIYQLRGSAHPRPIAELDAILSQEGVDKNLAAKALSEGLGYASSHAKDILSILKKIGAAPDQVYPFVRKRRDEGLNSWFESLWPDFDIESATQNADLQEMSARELIDRFSKGKGDRYWEAAAKRLRDGIHGQWSGVLSGVSEDKWPAAVSKAITDIVLDVVDAGTSEGGPSNAAEEIAHSVRKLPDPIPEKILALLIGKVKAGSTRAMAPLDAVMSKAGSIATPEQHDEWLKTLESRWKKGEPNERPFWYSAQVMPDMDMDAGFLAGFFESKIKHGVIGMIDFSGLARAAKARPELAPLADRSAEVVLKSTGNIGSWELKEFATWASRPDAPDSLKAVVQAKAADIVYRGYDDLSDVMNIPLIGDSRAVQEAIEYVKSGDPKKTSEAYKSLEHPKGVEVHKYTKDLRRLKKLLEKGVREVRDLKKADPRLMQRLQPLVEFTKGRPVTDEALAAFVEKLEKKGYSVERGEFKMNMQRSLSRRPSHEKVPQIVLKVIASKAHINEMEEKGCYGLFKKIVESYRSGSHPYAQNQIGWIRLDVSPDKEYLLVDEVQSDVMGSLHKGRQTLPGSTPEEMKAMTEALEEIVKDFPDVATEVVTEFAQKNGIKKIYWHTYEGGKALKGNQPPKSLYEKVPKDNYFEVTEDRPFKLPASFWSREASRAALLRIAARVARA